MRIDTLIHTNTSTVDSVEKIGTGSIRGGELSEAFHMDAGITTMNSTQSAKNGIMEGLSQDGSLESVQQTAKALQENLDAMMMKMDTGDVVTMDEDGVDVNELTPEEIVTVVEEIQIKLATWCDDYSLAGTGIDAADVARVNGSSVNAGRIANAMDTYQSMETSTDDAKAYLLKNHLEPTIQNVYMAQHSVAGMTQSHPLSDAQWAQLRPQVEQMLADTPLGKDETFINRARMLVEHEIEVTPQTMEQLAELDSLDTMDSELVMDRILATVTEGRDAFQTNLTGKTLPWEETMAAMQTLRDATPGNIMAWVEHTPDAVRSLDTLSDLELLNREATVDEANPAYTKAYRQVQEARLLMTMQAGRTLEKAGISINTLEISELIDRLMEQEQLALSVDSATSEHGSVAMSLVSEANEVILAFEDLKGAPHVVLGSVAKESQEATVENLTTQSQKLRTVLTKADAAYEALQTEVRGDLGDSLRKAVAGNADAILSELGYANEEANRRAVSILAYHQMELSQANIDHIKSLDSSMQRLFAELTPAKTLQMLRDGIDPMHTDITTLTDYLEALEDLPRTERVNASEGSSNRGAGERRTGKEEKYSEFLYRMEKHGEISEEERTQFIGIYRMIHQLTKDDLRALGGIVQQESSLTFDHLMSAYASGKDRGSELTVSDEMDTIQVRDEVNYTRNLFHSLKRVLEPQHLPLEEADRMAKFQEAAQTDPETIHLVAEQAIAPTLSNLKAAGKLQKEPGKIFEAYGERHEDQEENPLEGLLEKLADREALQESYEQAAQEIRETVNRDLYQYENYQDLATLRELSKSMSLMAHMARRDSYYIPYEAEDGTKGVMNVRVLAGTDTPGRFQIKLQAQQYGAVTVEGIMDEDALRVQLMSDSRDGVEALREREAAIGETLSNLGITAKLHTSFVTKQPGMASGVEAQVDTSILYKAAATIVKRLV